MPIEIELLVFDFSPCTCPQSGSGAGAPYEAVVLTNLGPYPVIAKFPSGSSTLLSPKERIGPSSDPEIVDSESPWPGMKVVADGTSNAGEQG